MTQNYISILNAPSGTSDIATSGGVITATGLSPYKANLVNSCTLQRSVAESLQVWSVAMTAVADNVYSFSIEQVVNGIPSLRTFSYTATSTTGSEIVTAIDGFFGATGNSSTYTDASWGAVKYKVTSSSASVTLTVSQVSGEAFPTVSNVSNTTVTSSMSLTLASQTNVDGDPISFKVTAGHGLATGALVRVGTLTGQTAANNKTARVVVLSSTNFNLQDPITGVYYDASGTGTAVGSVTVIATAAFGTAALVNDDASANGSTETATVTSSNYTLVSIEAGYPSGETPNLSTRTAPIHWWICETANGILLIDSIATSYLA